MKRKRPTSPDLPLEQSDLAVSFYDTAADHPKESFARITKRVVPRGFGKSKTSAAFKKEARKMFNLAR
ncbi:MAG: hypothetical protein WA197_23105 [Candidatus Acidiferrales bacterium]